MRRAETRAAIPTSGLVLALAGAAAALALAAGTPNLAVLVGFIAFLTGTQGLRTD
jgi:hypothetical protein